MACIYTIWNNNFYHTIFYHTLKNTRGFPKNKMFDVSKNVLILNWCIFAKYGKLLVNGLRNKTAKNFYGIIF